MLGQTVREFSSSFARAYSRLLEIDCRLPEVARAWAYLNAMQLTSSEELALLASVGNEYSPSRLQKAAIMHEKSLKGPWPFRKPGAFDEKRKVAKTYLTGIMEDEEHEDSDGTEIMPEELAYELHEAYVAQESAKAKYKDYVKARGYDSGGHEKGTERSASERLKLAKSRSFCAGCKRRGHWHRDPECPLNKSTAGGSGAGDADKDPKTKDAFVTHVAYVVGEANPNEKLLAITDCACSKSVAGQGWLEKYTSHAKDIGLEVPLHPCDENFRFGASKVFHASFLATILFEIEGRQVLIRVATVHGDVPLLLRTVLATLGMVYNMADHSASFQALGVENYKLLYTDTKHPAVPVEPQRPFGFEFPSPQQWGSDEIKILAQGARQYTAYMLSSGGSGLSTTTRVFFPKTETKVSNDFWLETSDAFYRIHVVPRRNLFRPDRWTIPELELKQQLLSELGSVRSTWPVSCSDHRSMQTVHDMWSKDDSSVAVLWIGRTVFARMRPESRVHRVPHGSQGERMAGQQEGADRDGPRAEDHRLRGLDHRRDTAPHPGASEGKQPDEHQRSPEGTGKHDADRAQEQGTGAGDRGTHHRDEGLPPAGHPGPEQRCGRGSGDLRTLPQPLVPGSSRRLSLLGDTRGGSKPECFHGTSPPGSLGRGQVREPECHELSRPGIGGGGTLQPLGARSVLNITLVNSGPEARGTAAPEAQDEGQGDAVDCGTARIHGARRPAM